MPMLSEQAVHDLYADFRRGVPGRPPDKNTPANAQFIDEEALRCYRCNPLDGYGPLLGKIGNDYFSTKRGEDRHVLLISSSRSGKGVSYIIPTLLTCKSSVFCVDPKGENYRLTGNRRKKMGQTVVAMAPFAKGGSPARYNPLAPLKPDSPTLVAEVGSISESLVLSSGQADNHWDDSSKNLINGVTLHVITHPAYAGRRNLVTVRELLRAGVRGHHAGASRAAGMVALYNEMEENTACDGIIAAVGAGMAEMPENERGSVASTARRHTSFLDLPQMQYVLSGHDFELSSLKTHKVSLFLILPAYHMSRCSRWLRLFVNLVLQEMEQVETKPELPVLMILDEFAVLGHVAALENAAGQIAGFDVKLFVILQDLGQLKSLYGDRFETFIGNSGVVIFFGNGDLTTCEYTSRTLGQTSVLADGMREVSAEDRSKKGFTGYAKSHSMAPLLSPDEIARYFRRDDAKRRALVLFRGENSAVFSRCLSYNDGLLTPLLDAA